MGVPRNADKALTAIRESDGIVVNVSDQEIMAAQQLLGRTCGVFGEPAGVTGAAGVKKLCEQGVIGKDDTVVSVVTGNGLKDVANAIKAAGEPISIPSDMDRLLAAFAEKRHHCGISGKGPAGDRRPFFSKKFSDPRNDPLPFSDDIGESSFHKERGLP